MENTHYKIFGGIPWKCLFTRKPSFSEGGEVFLCSGGYIPTATGRGIYYSPALVYIDGIQLDYFTAEGEADIPLTDEGGEGYPAFMETYILDYLQRKEVSPLLLPEIRKGLPKDKGGEPSPEVMNKILTIRNYLERDFLAGPDKALHKALKEEVITALSFNGKEAEKLFFGFFERQGVIRKAESIPGKYIILKPYTPEDFAYISKKAVEKNLVPQYVPRGQFFRFFVKSDKKIFENNNRFGNSRTKKLGEKKRPPFFKQYNIE